MGRVQGSALLTQKRINMKTIDCLLTPKIKSENVTFDTLIGYPLDCEKVICDENIVEISKEKIVIKGRGKD